MRQKPQDTTNRAMSDKDMDVDKGAGHGTASPAPKAAEAPTASPTGTAGTAQLALMLHLTKEAQKTQYGGASI